MGAIFEPSRIVEGLAGALSEPERIAGAFAAARLEAAWVVGPIAVAFLEPESVSRISVSASEGSAIVPERCDGTLTGSASISEWVSECL